MTNTEAANVLLNLAVKGKTAYHPGYDRTVQYAEDLKAYFAGVNAGKYLRIFARRESQELFEQRLEITSHIQSALGAMLSRAFAKTSRSNYTKVLAINGDEQGERAKAFEVDTLDKFSSKGLTDYTFERIRYFRQFDPNAWVVVDFEDFDNRRTKARPYPFEVLSSMAVDFKYNRYSELLYLVCRQLEDKDDEKDVERLTLWMPKQTLVFQQLTREETRTYTNLPPKTKELLEGEAAHELIIQGGNAKYYRLLIPIPHGFEETPAVRVSDIDCVEDDGQTKLSIFDPALPHARKLLKINSELDLLTSLLAFPIPIEYGDVCGAVGCNHGQLPDNSMCTTCHGTGYKDRPTSVAERIVLPRPENNADMVDVNKLYSFIQPPTDGIRLVLDIWQKCMEDAQKALFNSQMFTKQDVAQTATYHGIELQAVYDTLYPYGQYTGHLYGFLAKCCYVFQGGKPSEFTGGMYFPQDFRFETADQLFAELKSADEADAGPNVRAVLQDRIMARLLMDDDEGAMRYRVDRALDPFPGLTTEQITAALQSSLTPEWRKVWFVNRADIISEILAEDAKFYQKRLPDQQAKVKEKALAILAQINAEKPDIQLGLPFGNRSRNAEIEAAAAE